MALPWRVCTRLVLQSGINFISKRFYPIRPPKRLGGKPFNYERVGISEEDLTFKEKLAIFNMKQHSPALEALAATNIGESFKPDLPSKAERRRVIRDNRKNEQLEYAARHKELSIPLDQVREDWMKEYGPHHFRAVVSHYGIFEDLFNRAYFVPTIDMTIAYDYDDEFVTPVFLGNSISSKEATNEPHVEFEAEEGSLYTLLMTNPDGHLTDNNSEYLHWLVTNIPGDDVKQGEVLCDYLRPFPAKGTGFHRHVFVLFKQTGTLDMAEHRRSQPCISLKERTFKTVDFYRSHEEALLPVAIKFFQCEWEDSVREVYHDILKMKEPEFAYRHPPPYHPKQRTYPRKQPFDRYMDRYRDSKDLAEEVVRLKLENTSPFAGRTPPPKYPLIHRPKGYKASWLKRKEELMHRRQEQYRDLP